VKLRALFDHAPEHFAERMIAGLSSDSRMIKKDFAFFALAGSKAHGAQYIRDAIAQGASTVIAEG